MNKKVLIHGAFMYCCESCNEMEVMFLEEGVEGPGKKQPCPFTITCPYCKQGFMSHIMWNLDTFFPTRELNKGESYFGYDEKLGHGKPKFKKR